MLYYYALVKNGKIVVGPREYHPAFFKDYTTKENIDAKIPSTYAADQPIEINENLRIVPVVMPDIPPHNMVTEQPAGPFWVITPEMITGTYDVVDRELEAARNIVKDRLSSIRYQKENTSFNHNVGVKEVELDSRRETRKMWAELYITASDEQTRSYKFPHNVWVDINKTDIYNILVAIDSKVQQAFDWERAVSLSLDQAETKAEIEQIDIQVTEEEIQATVQARL
jgi:hypothetical protein